MIKQLKMINKEKELIIVDEENNELFKINLNDMIFNSQKFYESFFKGITEKICYNIINEIDEKTSVDYKKNVRIYENIKKLFNDIQVEVNKLFEKEEENQENEKNI
jgi:hypothetical protein